MMHTQTRTLAARQFSLLTAFLALLLLFIMNGASVQSTETGIQVFEVKQTNKSQRL